uniref:Eyes absent homolog n=1 Tax=Meloidogyne incognita TaxID=6306 RepID=A0A914M9S4_MELIC
MTASTKFEPETLDASSSSLSMPSRNPYWATSHEWDLAMGRSDDGGQQSLNNINSQQQLQQQQQNSAAYYEQMIAAASANGSGQTSAWYPTQNYVGYYGLGGVQRVGAALNGYLGSPYSGVYPHQAVDYYNAAAASFPGSYYAAAASSAKALASHYGQQPQQHLQNYPAILSMNNSNKYPPTILMDPQAIATGSELDTSPPLNNGSAVVSPPPLETDSHNNGSTKSSKSRNKGEKCGGASLNIKRSKKKKISAVRSQSQELNQTRVFVWELEDVCSILPQNHYYKDQLEIMLNEALSKLLEHVFNLENFDDFDQTNIMDAEMDEALHNANPSNSFSDELSNNNIQHSSTNPPSSIPNSSSNLNKQTGISSTDGYRKLAEKCRNVKNVFERYRRLSSFAELLEHCGLPSNQLITHLDNIEKFPEASIALFRECLSFIHKRSPLLKQPYVNVILSSNQIEGGIAGAFGRLMLCRLGEYIEAENVFCITRNGRETVFERLINQFQKKLIVFISNNEETKKFAETHDIPCWPGKLPSNNSLINLRSALEYILCDISQPTNGFKEQQQNSFL